VLAAGEEIPETVRDAVLARAARLTPAARALVDAVAIAPPEAELSLLEQSAREALPALVECLTSECWWRRTAPRLSVTSLRGLPRKRRSPRTKRSSSTARRSQLSGPHLRGRPTSRGLPITRRRLATPTRCSSSRRRPVIAHLGFGAHREAAAQYARALRFAGGLPPEQRADLLGRHAFECYVTTQDEDALASSQQALEVHRERGDLPKQLEALASIAQAQLNMGASPDAIETASEAAS
jgi:hypothetical protein